MVTVLVPAFTAALAVKLPDPALKVIGLFVESNAPLTVIVPPLGAWIVTGSAKVEESMLIV